MGLEREIRLIITLALTGVIFTAGYRLFRRRGRRPHRAASDALLFFFLCQYVSVTIPGILGILSAWSIGICSLLFSAVLWFLGNGFSADRRSASRLHTYVFAVALAIGIGYAGGYLWVLRWMPVVSNDAMTYHFPAAVQWLQEGRLGLYTVWYFNPANTYSPLAGSTFIAWWMGLLGDDLLARYVQFPALILIGVTSFSLFRRLRCRVIPASMLMVGVVLCDPILSQMTMSKDDLYVVAFFICSVNALARSRDLIQTAIAVGLMLACKTTALLMLPVLVLMMGPPTRWKHWTAAAIGALVLAGPWYIRNWIIAGNPLFPVDFLFWKGLCATRPASELTSIDGLTGVLFRGTYAIPPVVGIMFAIGWLAAVIRYGRLLLRSSLLRIVLLGPWLGLGLYRLTAPFPELRFILPLVVLMFAGASLAIRTLRPRSIQSIVAGVLAGTCAVTAFHLDDPGTIAEFVIVVLVSIAIAAVIVAARSYRPHLAVAGATVLIGLIYVRWNAYVDELELDTGPVLLTSNYGQPTIDAWTYVEQNVPAGEPIAYANTFYVYPLMGQSQQRRIAYAPTRPGLKAQHDLPRIGDRLTGEALANAARHAQVEPADEATWLSNLRNTKATHLVVFLDADRQAPPEQIFAQRQSAVFQRVFDNEAALVYRITW